MSTETGPDAHVPPPVPPSDPDAWYAPDVRAQYEPYPGVVTTVRERDDDFTYETREPALTAALETGLDRVHDHFSDATRRRPRTREGTGERMREGFEPKYRRVIDRLVSASPAARRRLDYYALRDLRCLGEVTPLALDDRVEVADTTDDRLVVHTTDYAPARTDLPADTSFLGRFASERLAAYTVSFRGFDLPVVVYREQVLGRDAFTTKYAVMEPDLLPGDEALIEECKERIWEGDVDGVVADPAAFVRQRARDVLSRRLTARNTRAWLDATAYRLRKGLAAYGVGVPPVGGRYSEDRLSDLVYYVLRDFVGQGKLTVPVRDPNLEDIEANRVGERIKVVPRGSLGVEGRLPTNLTFDTESEFVNVVTRLAAADGTELNASTPSAKVNLAPEGVPDDVTIRCAVALPTISEDGPHISIRKQAADALTPVDLIEGDSITTELVALLWMLYEHHCVVLFAGPTGVGKTTLMNAHMPFIPFDERPISIDEGSREVALPHETGVSLTTRDHEAEHKRVTMADLMTECNYLNPDVEVIAEINTPASFATFAETLNTGHGVIGTTHAEDVETLVNRVVEQGLPSYLLQEIDVVVFPRRVGTDRYVGEVVEFVSGDADVSGRGGVVRKDGTEIYWNSVAQRQPDGTTAFDYDHPALGDDERRSDVRVFDHLADRTDRTVEAVETEFHRKHRYVRYLQHAGVDDVDDLFAFVADLATDEAATVERVSRESHGDDTLQPPADDGVGVDAVGAADGPLGPATTPIEDVPDEPSEREPISGGQS